jgi:hypothetical protein
MFHTWPMTGEDINDYLTLNTIPPCFVCNYKMQTQRSSHHTPMRESLNRQMPIHIDMVDYLENFIVYCCYEGLK